jgi:serine/threonine-protein kinase
VPSADLAFGRYRLLQLLGKGGMGEVHLATSHGAAGFEKLVAVKIVKPKASEPDVTDRGKALWREAMLGARLDHECVVHILDLGEEADQFYVVMEYVRGFSLSTVITHLKGVAKALPIRCAVHVARRVADALVYVHGLADENGQALGFLHGDVSPANVLLGQDGRIKLTDFGVAAFESELSGGGLIAGKLPYMPAEAYSGERKVQSWDVYALAAVLYRAIAGRPAFPGRTYEAVQAAVQRGPHPLIDLRPDCPTEVAEVIHQGLSRAGQRYETALQFRRALDEALPRRVDDSEKHAAFIRKLYADGRFVEVHGELPTAGSTSQVNPAVFDKTERQTVQNVASPRSLRFGLSPAHGPRLAKARGEALVSVLADRLGREVRCVVFADYETLVDCVIQCEVDFAWMPPASFVDAADRGAGLAVVAQRAGAPSYDSVLFVRAEAPARELRDLIGQSVAWVDRNSCAGYLFAAAEITRSVGALDQVFSSQHFHGSHRAVCEAVLNGWAGAGATYTNSDAEGRIVNPAWNFLIADRAAELRAIALAGPIPGDNITTRPGFPLELRAKLVEVFRDLCTDDGGRHILHDVFAADEFVEATVELYEPTRRVLRELGR